MFVALVLAIQKNNYGKSTISVFSGKTISIPDSIICYIKDKVVDYNFDGAGFKIICFIDSDGCTPCLMKLPLWQHALNDFSSISERPIDFLMVLRTSKTAKLYKEFEINNFNHPFTWDSLGVINIDGESRLSKANKVFLLDANDSILIVGNPIYNNKLYSLYKHVLKSNANEEIKVNESQNVELCSNPVNAIGAVSPGTHISNEYIIENKTDDVLYIEDILKSCNCIDVKAEYDTIPRNERVKIYFSFRADSLSGSFEHVVSIVFRNNIHQTLRVQGFIVE